MNILPFVSSCSSLVFDFRLPLCILLFFFGFRLPITSLYPPVLLWFSTTDYPLYPPVFLWFSTSDYPFVSSSSSLVFDFRIPLCITLFFFGFRLPITPLYPPFLLCFSTSDYPFVSSNVSYQFMIFAYYFL